MKTMRWQKCHEDRRAGIDRADGWVSRFTQADRDRDCALAARAYARAKSRIAGFRTHNRTGHMPGHLRAMYSFARDCCAMLGRNLYAVLTPNQRQGLANMLGIDVPPPIDSTPPSARELPKKPPTRIVNEENEHE